MNGETRFVCQITSIKSNFADDHGTAGLEGRSGGRSVGEDLRAGQERHGHFQFFSRVGSGKLGLIVEAVALEQAVLDRDREGIVALRKTEIFGAHNEQRFPAHRGRILAAKAGFYTHAVRFENAHFAFF